MALRRMRLLEVAVVVAIVAILYGVLSNTLVVLGERAERAAVQGMLGQLKQQLNIKLAQYYIVGNKDLQSLQAENPFMWLERPPENYRGELASLVDIMNQPENEVWFFDTSNRELVYKVNRHQFLTIEGQNQQILRFVLNLNQSAADKQGKAETATSTVYHGVFSTAVPFTWQIDTPP